MINKKVLFCCLFLSTLLLIACGGGSGGDSDDTSPEDNTVSSDIGGDASGSTSSPSEGNPTSPLEGTWKKLCGIGDGEDPADPYAFYGVVTIKMTESNFESDIKNYSDSGCTIPFAPAPNPTAKGTLTLGSSITTTGGLQATELDSHITEFNGAPFTIDDFDIFSIDVDTLYFGDISGEKDGTTPALRPDTLDFNQVFVRQQHCWE